ncbi:MAG: 3-phosphoshikimate 1-carboxyvinyltransferase [Endomicrobiales bacterium]|nr:3-phosphoshikimate 1-carboxyvinyltransferase [Endomicrobiales bacterium]
MNSHWEFSRVKKLSGEISVPADKSITHRAIMFSSIANGVSRIENYLASGDCNATIRAFSSMDFSKLPCSEGMGVRIIEEGSTLEIHGVGLNGLIVPKTQIDAGNSGTTVRLLSGILAGQNFSSTMVGDASLSKRPMKRIIEPLSEMGAVFSLKENSHLPFTITGSKNLKAINYKSLISSAQVKSCILLAGLYANGVTTFSEPTKSRDHTERMLKARGAKLNVDGNTVSIEKTNELKAMDMVVPGDISSAAFFIVAGLIVPNSKITLKNVGINPTRDGILEILKKMGAKITLQNKRDVCGEPVVDILVESSELKAVEFGGEIIPRLIDEIPILALAATQAKGQTKIYGAQELRVKESDRIKTIASELTKMGADIEETEDGLIINGPTKLKGAKVESYNDHRIAMMLSIASLIADGKTYINDVVCVGTSYAKFRSDLDSIKGA